MAIRMIPWWQLVIGHSWSDCDLCHGNSRRSKKTKSELELDVSPYHPSDGQIYQSWWVTLGDLDLPQSEDCWSSLVTLGSCEWSSIWRTCMSIEHANHGKGWKTHEGSANWIRDPKLFSKHSRAKRTKSVGPYLATCYHPQLKVYGSFATQMCFFWCQNMCGCMCAHAPVCMPHTHTYIYIQYVLKIYLSHSKSTSNSF